MGESIGIYRKFKVRYYSIINVYGHIRITLKINFMFNNLKLKDQEIARLNRVVDAQRDQNIIQSVVAALKATSTTPA